MTRAAALSADTAPAAQVHSPPIALTAEWISWIEGCSLKEARRRLREGLCGPAFRRGKRLLVLRRDYEKALQRAARINAIGGAA